MEPVAVVDVVFVIKTKNANTMNQVPGHGLSQNQLKQETRAGACMTMNDEC